MLKGKGYESEMIWRCECGGCHFISIRRQAWHDELDQWLTIESYSANPDLWWRIKEAWHILRQSDHHAEWCQTMLDDANAREIAQTLLEAADFHEKWDGEKSKYDPNAKRETFRWQWWRGLRYWWQDLHPLLMLALGMVVAELVRWKVG